jgi:hypothetical protein
VALAGHMLLLQLSLIELRLHAMLLGLILTYLLKFWSHVNKKILVAMVVLLTLLTNGSSIITSLMRLVPFIRVVVGQMVLDAVLWQCAVIAKLDKHALYLMNTILMEYKNTDKSKANRTWWMKSTNVVQSLVLSLIQQILKHILMVFIMTQQVVLMKIMKLVLSVGVKKMVLNSGALEIHGELTGVKMDSSELWEVLIISISKVIAIGEYRLIPGPIKLST